MNLLRLIDFRKFSGNPPSFYVSTWIARTTPSVALRAIAWSKELNRFCAVAQGGFNGIRTLTSSTGVTWIDTTQNFGTIGNYNTSKIAWSPELGLFCTTFFIGGDNIATSADGLTWTRSIAPGGAMYGVCWSKELGKFFVGGGGQVSYSSNGTTWASSGLSTTVFNRDICWSAELGLLCTVGENATGPCIATSPDGDNWTTAYSNADYQLKGVCWSKQLNLFCAVGINAPGGTATGGVLLTSPNGITWTVQTIPVSTVRLAGVAWSAELGLFCAISNSSTGATLSNRIITSPDGVNWTSRPLPGTYLNFLSESVCWSKETGLFCAAGGSTTPTTNRIVTSTPYP